LIQTAFEAEQEYIDTRLRDVDPAVFEKWKHQLPATLAKRANYFMTEFSRVNEALEAYRQGDIEKLGAVMFASGLSSTQEWESGCPEMIALYNIMTETSGIYGGRFSGAGFKGCCRTISDPSKRESILSSVSQRYLEQFPELKGQYSAHVCKTADGARKIG